MMNEWSFALQPERIKAAFIFVVAVAVVLNCRQGSSSSVKQHYQDHESNKILNVPCRMTLFWSFVIVVVFQTKPQYKKNM